MGQGLPRESVQRLLITRHSLRIALLFGHWRPFRPEATVFRPSQERFSELAQEGNLIPVVREVMADLDTPVSSFQRLDDGSTSFLLESVQGGPAKK